jgi:hypothetical protein
MTTVTEEYWITSHWQQHKKRTGDAPRRRWVGRKVGKVIARTQQGGLHSSIAHQAPQTLQALRIFFLRNSWKIVQAAGLPVSQASA